MADDTKGIDRLKQVIAERLERVAELEAELGKHDPEGLDDAQALAELAELDEANDEEADQEGNDEEDEAANEPKPRDVRSLRREYKQVGRRIRDLEERVASATALPVADQLEARGFDPKYAKFYASQDRSEAAVSAWIDENSELLGAMPSATPAEEAYVPDAPDANAVAAMSIQSLADLPATPAPPFKPKLKRPKTLEGLNKFLQELPDGEDGWKAMEEVGLIAKPEPVAITPKYPDGIGPEIVVPPRTQ
jgi:hypothetical protein